MIKIFPLFLLAVVAGVEGLSLNKDSNSIIEVSIDCGASVGENSPVLKILTDVDITAVAKCKNGDQSFTSTDSVHYILPATLTSSVELCQLNEKESDNYDITVEVHYGEADGLILTKSKRVTVVCTYSDYGKDDSPQHSISNGPQAHIEKQTLVGTSVPASDIKLNIQTVDNQDAVGAIAFDRRYSLFGSYTGIVTNVGLKPVSCYAVSDDGESYAVLTAGCGDGFIFDRTDGFITTGKTFRSPYFFAFNLANSGNLAFKCNVTLCTDCDGTSCETDCGSERYAITNGQLDGCKGNNKYEDTCTYVCDTGHDKEGDGISTCGADGIWTVPPIVCTPKDCGSPPDGTASTGSANDGTTFTKEATYSCNTGYEKLSGNAKISCLSTGNWDTDNILDCQVIPTTTEPTTTTTEPTTTTAEPTTTTAEPTTTTAEPTTTTAEPTTTIEEIMTCPRPPMSAINSRFDYYEGNDFDGVAHYKCNIPGYEYYNGSSQLDCIEGIWDFEPLMNCKKCEETIKSLPNHLIEIKGLQLNSFPAADQGVCDFGCTGICAVAAFHPESKACRYYEYPIIKSMVKTDFDSCIKWCDDDKDCMLVSDYYITTNEAFCFMFDQPVRNFVVSVSKDDNHYGEKRCRNIESCTYDTHLSSYMVTNEYQINGPKGVLAFTKEACDAQCTGNCNAVGYHSSRYICMLFTFPVIKAVEQSLGFNFTSCIDACSEHSNCITVSNYFFESDGGFCLMFNMPAASFKVNDKATSESNFAEKKCNVGL